MSDDKIPVGDQSGYMIPKNLRTPIWIYDYTGLFEDQRAPWPGEMKCQRCGRWCKELFPVYCSNPHDGVDYEICSECNEGGKR